MTVAYPDAVKLRARELRAAGKPYLEIARELDVPSTKTVYEWVNGKKGTGETRGTKGTERERGSEHHGSSHGQSKAKAQEELDVARAALLHELVALTEERPADAGPVDPEKLASRLDALVEDLITAARKQIPFADLKGVSGAIKVGVEMARLLRGKATSIVGSTTVLGATEERREQLVGRMRGLGERFRERARSAGIRGVVASGDPGGAGRAAGER
jgi:transposase-like protein